jgi:hypothetical protein
VAAAGGDPSYDLFYDEPAETPYETDTRSAETSCGGDGEIQVLTRDGLLAPFTSVSPMTQALNRQLMFRRIHVAAQRRETVESAVRALRSP